MKPVQFSVYCNL